MSVGRLQLSEDAVLSSCALGSVGHLQMVWNELIGKRYVNEALVAKAVQ